MKQNSKDKAKYDSMITQQRKEVNMIMKWYQRKILYRQL